MLSDAPPPYRTVVFDCDSTLSAMEGIEELALPQQRAELKRLTDLAMDGRVALEEVFGQRLELVRPSRSDVTRIGELYVERVLPNAPAVLKALAALGKRIVIVSGGLRPAVRILAERLGVTEVQAVDVRFDERGRYADFDRDSPLARSGGKIEVLQALALEAAPLAFVGDGATDVEAAHLAARFVAYGGVERRANVFEAARVTCEAPDYRALLPLLLAPDELQSLRSLPEHAALAPPPSPSP